MEALGSSTTPGATEPFGDSYFGLDSPFQGYEIPPGTEGKSRKCTPRGLDIASLSASGEDSSFLTLAKAGTGSPVAGGKKLKAASADAAGVTAKVSFLSINASINIVLGGVSCYAKCLVKRAAPRLVYFARERRLQDHYNYSYCYVYGTCSSVLVCEGLCLECRPTKPPYI